jgi:hypothetical protein
MIVSLVALVALSGCAASVPAPSPAVVVPAEDIQHLAVVAMGESRFTVMYQSNAQMDRTLDEVLKWIPNATAWRGLARVVQWGVNWLGEAKREASTAPHVRDLLPRSVVAEAFARTLRASGRFGRVRVHDSEPVGGDRRDADVIVRLAVPSWGLLHVREGKPDLLAGFADVRAQMVAPETGVVLWEHEEDVTHPERLPLQAFSRDRELARQQLTDVLERAGRRLANEYVYARGTLR